MVVAAIPRPAISIAIFFISALLTQKQDRSFAVEHRYPPRLSQWFHQSRAFVSPIVAAALASFIFPAPLIAARMCVI